MALLLSCFPYGPTKIGLMPYNHHIGQAVNGKKMSSIRLVFGSSTPKMGFA
jgi:hypothetical protein